MHWVWSFVAFIYLADWHSYCQASCPNYCKRCTDSNNCVECIAGKYGQLCELDCLSTCRNGACDKRYGNCSDICLDHQYFAPWASHCFNCSFRCERCVNLTQCTNCSKPYYWGSACQYDCVSCFGVCNKTHGCTAGCHVKYFHVFSVYKNGFECRRCEDTCRICTSPLNCTTCEDGYWGQYCQYNCTGCSTDCDKDNGCVAGCIIGYYKYITYNKQQCIRCPENCLPCPLYCNNANCYPNNGTCIYGCKTGWSGQHCDNQCPPNCQQCGQFNNSVCSSCAIGFYGDGCNQTCSINCKNSNGSQTCKKGNGTCSYGCEDGYWGKDCGEICPQTCNDAVCNRATGVCLNGCIESFYGSRCDKSCGSNCRSKICHVYNGSCTNGCVPGWSASYCDQQCPSNCYQCDQFNTLFCDLCETGFYGENCNRVCNGHCKHSDAKQTCEKKNGTCIHGCEDGYWENDCSSICSQGCNNSVCDRVLGDCAYGCSNTFYGKRCDQECGSNCQTSTDSLRLCDEISGSCYSGCIEGWYGLDCTFECNRSCIDSTCFQNNGTCVKGYTKYYTRMDSYTTSTDHSGLPSKTESGASVVVPVASGVGATAVLAVVTVIIVVLYLNYRRKARKKQYDTISFRNAPNQKENVYATYSTSGEDHNKAYEDLQRPRSEEGAYSSIASDYENTCIQPTCIIKT